MATIRLTLKRAWWVMPYLFGVHACTWLTGLEPDMDKVCATALKGFKVVTK